MERRRRSDLERAAVSIGFSLGRRAPILDLFLLGNAGAYLFSEERRDARSRGISPFVTRFSNALRNGALFGSCQIAFGARTTDLEAARDSVYQLIPAANRIKQFCFFFNIAVLIPSFLLTLCILYTSL